MTTTNKTSNGYRTHLAILATVFSVVGWPIAIAMNGAMGFVITSMAIAWMYVLLKSIGMGPRHLLKMGFALTCLVWSVGWLYMDWHMPSLVTATGLYILEVRALLYFLLIK